MDAFAVVNATTGDVIREWTWAEDGVPLPAGCIVVRVKKCLGRLPVRVTLHRVEARRVF